MNSSGDEIIETWGKVHNMIFASLNDHLDDEYLKEILYSPLKELGKQSAEGISGNARTAGEAIMDFEKHWDIEGKVIRNTRSEFVREVTYCPWAYFRPLSCRTLAWYMEGFCEGVNPDCCYKLQKLMPEGADVCLWIISCKEHDDIVR